MPRYQWKKNSDLPERVELIDVVTTQQAAVILNISRRWHWKRSTSVMIHGAPPAEGVDMRLSSAKKAVVAGLPDAPSE